MNTVQESSACGSNDRFLGQLKPLFCMKSVVTICFSLEKELNLMMKTFTSD